MSDYVYPADMKTPLDHDKRMEAARNRARWELGDGSWADIILAAYLKPEQNAQALERDMNE